MPPESTMADLNKGIAMMRWSRVPMPDQQDLMNALNNGPAFPATVSFDVRWSGGMQKRKTLRNSQHRFALQIMETAATIEWQAERGDLRLTSDAGTAKTVYAFVGRERNGIFF